MNYNHAYHAGNFADLIKHITLISLLRNLKKKQAPFHVIDSFAGQGLYDLSSIESQKTNEHINGYYKLKRFDGDFPEIISGYLEIINKYSNHKEIYTGSPIIISEELRDIDRADFCELKSEIYEELKYNLYQSRKKIASHKIDGYQALKSLLPPTEKRGLVVLDPPFEVTDEFERLISATNLISKRYLQATILIWYPIKDSKKVHNFYEAIKKLKRESLKIEFSIDDSNSNLSSTGLVIINPPFIEKELALVFSFLREKIYEQKAKIIISKLYPNSN
jgi:23S rRNA (adenine2030-N6)-methyltransferase